jgi:hypothetical protein
MNKTILWIAVLLIFVAPAFASDWCYANTTCETFADIHNGSVFYDADTASITVYNPNEVIVVNDQPMQKFATGRFVYNTSYEAIGIHYAYVDFKNSTGGVIAQGSQSFAIRGGISNMLETIAIILGMILIGAIFIGISMWSGNYIWYAFAGTWYLTMMFVFENIIRSINPWYGYLFFFAMGLFCLLEAADIFKSTKKKRRDV